jgi:hypothetical protein
VPGPWTALGYPTRAAYRAAQQALGHRHYPLESQQRKAREGTAYGHGGDKFVRQFRDMDTAIVIFENIVIKGWRYVKGKGWLTTTKDVPSRVAVVVDAQYAYDVLRQTKGGMKAYAAELLNSSFNNDFTADQIKRVGTVTVREI